MILTVCESGIIVILVGDMTGVPGLMTAVADKRSVIHSGTLFKDEVLAGSVALVAGAAKIVADDEFAADIGFPAFEAMDTEVVGVIEGASVPCIKTTVEPDLFGNRGRILTEESGDILERLTIIK